MWVKATEENYERPQFTQDAYQSLKRDVILLRDFLEQQIEGIRQPQTSGPGWFRKMDRNQDGDLTWREFFGTREDFAEIDADGDGLIDLDEAVSVE